VDCVAQVQRQVIYRLQALPDSKQGKVIQALLDSKQGKVS